MAAESEFGVVRAATSERAAETSELLADLVPRIAALIPGACPSTVEVWLQRELAIYRNEPFPDHVAGMTEYAQGRIYLRDRDAELRLHLAHELVHLMLTNEWDALPAVLEEGLCDYVAFDIASDSRSPLRVWRLLEAGGVFGGIDATVEIRAPRHDSRRGRMESHSLRLAAHGARQATMIDVLEMSDQEVFDRSTEQGGTGLYGVGYFVVGRIVMRHGYEGLHRLCIAAGGRRIPAATVLEAAGLRQDAESLRLEVAAEFSAHDLPDLAPLCAVDLAISLSELGRQLYPKQGAIEFLRSARPSLSLSTSRARLPLIASSTFVSALIERW